MTIKKKKKKCLGHFFFFVVFGQIFRLLLVLKYARKKKCHFEENLKQKVLNDVKISASFFLYMKNIKKNVSLKKTEFSANYLPIFIKQITSKSNEISLARYFVSLIINKKSENLIFQRTYPLIDIPCKKKGILQETLKLLFCARACININEFREHPR